MKHTTYIVQDTVLEAEIQLPLVPLATQVH